MLSLQENLYIYNKIVGDVDHGKRKHGEASQLIWEIISQEILHRFWNPLPPSSPSLVEFMNLGGNFYELF